MRHGKRKKGPIIWALKGGKLILRFTLCGEKIFGDVDEYFRR
jgi:hypothetical protein